MIDYDTIKDATKQLAQIANGGVQVTTDSKYIADLAAYTFNVNGIEVECLTDNDNAEPYGFRLKVSSFANFAQMIGKGKQ